MRRPATRNRPKRKATDRAVAAGPAPDAAGRFRRIVAGPGVRSQRLKEELN